MKLPFLRKKQKPEIRADTTETSLLTFFGLSGEITREAALEIPTVSACISKISDIIANLPIKLYKKVAEKVVEIHDDPRLKLLNGETGDTLNTADMWKSAIADYYLGSGAWIYINSDGIKVKSLHYVSDTNISFMQNTDPIFKAYKILVGGKQYYDFQFLKLLRKTRDGYTNIPIQKDNPTILSAAYNALKLENSIALSGGCKSGFLKAKSRLSKEAIDSIKSGYSKIYDNSGTKEKMVVLNEGIDFQEISSSSVEMQMNEIKKTNSIEICKIFGFPHTIIDGGATPEDKKSFISVIVSIVNEIETALDTYLLLESEKSAGYYFVLDTKELTRGSILERYQAYEIALRNHFLQIDEIRKEEDYESLGFNFITLGLGDVLLNPETKLVYTPNTNQITKLKEGKTDED